MSEKQELGRRTETARQNDDSDLIENAIETPDFQGRAGGDLAKDVATQVEKERIGDPDATEGVTKGDEISHGMFDFSDQKHR